MYNIADSAISADEIAAVQLEGQENPLVSDSPSVNQAKFDALPKLIAERMNTAFQKMDENFAEADSYGSTAREELAQNLKTYTNKVFTLSNFCKNMRKDTDYTAFHKTSGLALGDYSIVVPDTFFSIRLGWKFPDDILDPAQYMLAFKFTGSDTFVLSSITGMQHDASLQKTTIYFNIDQSCLPDGTAQSDLYEKTAEMVFCLPSSHYQSLLRLYRAAIHADMDMLSVAAADMLAAAESEMQSLKNATAAIAQQIEKYAQETLIPPPDYPGDDQKQLSAKYAEKGSAALTLVSHSINAVQVFAEGKNGSLDTVSLFETQNRPFGFENVPSETVFDDVICYLYNAENTFIGQSSKVMIGASFSESELAQFEGLSGKTVCFGVTFEDGFALSDVSYAYIRLYPDLPGTDMEALKLSPESAASAAGTGLYVLNMPPTSDVYRYDGQVVTLKGSYVFYPAPAGYGVQDRFTYIQNPPGGVSAGTVSFSVYGRVMTWFDAKSYTDNTAQDILDSAKDYTDHKIPSSAWGALTEENKITIGIDNAYADMDVTADVDLSPLLTKAAEQAESYTDESAFAVLEDAKNYADNSASEALDSAKSYADTALEQAITQAYTYTDGKAQDTLGNAKDYTDHKIPSSAWGALTEENEIAIGIENAYADMDVVARVDLSPLVTKAVKESGSYTDASISGTVTQRVDFAGEFDGQKLPGAVGGITKIVFYANNYPVYEGTPLSITLGNENGDIASQQIPEGFSGNDSIVFDPGNATIEWYREDDYYQSINNDAFLSEMANADRITIYDSYAEATYADVTYMANLDGRFRQANHDAGVQAEEALTKANTYTEQAIKNIEVLLNNQPITTKTGETITVADSIGVVKKLIINGGFSYTGEPSIENPVDVSFTQNFTATGTDFSNTMDLSAYELKGNYSSAQAKGIYDSIEVDYTQKTVKHIKRYHKYTFTQSSPIEYAGGGFESVERYRMKITHAGDPPCIPENWYYGYCNVLPIDRGYTFGYEKSCIGISSNMMYFKVQKSYGTDVAVIKDLLVEKGAYIWYPLETPVETDITETQIGKALLGIDFLRESFHLQTTGASGKHEMTYIQDINKVLEEMKNALTALGAVE